jgi:hypothetical protein
VTQEKREIYAQIAERMRGEPIKGVKGDTFNGIQSFKQLLGIPTKINPLKLEPTNIHREQIKWNLLNDIDKVKEFRKNSLMESTCEFCGPSNSVNSFKGTKSEMKKHHRTKHGKRQCELCDEQFLNGALYAKHKKVTHNNQMWPCDKCNLSFESSEKMEAHRKGSKLMKCMHRCIKAECSHKNVSYAGMVDHVIDKHKELFQKIAYYKNGGYQFKMSKKKSKEVE